MIKSAIYSLLSFYVQNTPPHPGRGILSRFASSLCPTRPQTFEEQLYHAILRPGDLVFDVGANVGHAAAYMAKLVGPAGTVIAFEPVWPTYVRLCAQARVDGARSAAIIPVPCAVGENSTTITIHVPANSELASTAPIEQWSQVQGGVPFTSYESQVVSLDGFTVSRHLGQPAFVKIDVEGAELFALRGAERLLSTAPKPLLLIEVFAPWEKAFGYYPFEVFAFLRKLEYELLFVCPEGLVAHTPSAADPFPIQYREGYNVIAFHMPSHQERIASLSAFRLGARGKILWMQPAPLPNIIQVN